jgi:hypothetical protein
VLVRNAVDLDTAMQPDRIGLMISIEGAEVPGNDPAAEEHIKTAMNSRGLEMELYDLWVKVFGDIALSWGNQTVRGHLEPDDPRCPFRGDVGFPS